MRLNRYIALTTGCSRRAADELIQNHRVKVNSVLTGLSTQIRTNDNVTLDGEPLILPDTQYLLLNKPAGYVVSRARQDAAPTIYNLLPPQYHHLKPVGRLDKDSCGVLLLTNDGELANHLTHPRYQKTKVYIVKLHKPLTRSDLAGIKRGVKLKDGVSHLNINIRPMKDKLRMMNYEVSIKEGKNRQIRRTFAALGYEVLFLQRQQFGDLKLDNLKAREWQEIPQPNLSL